MSLDRTALNTYDARNRNLAAVLNAVRNGKGLSRTEIAKSMPFSLQTMTNVTQELIAMGLVEEVARPGTGRKGNPHTGLRVVPRRCCALGAQIRWNRCSMALVDLDHGMVAEAAVPISSFAPEPFVAEVIGALKGFLADHPGEEVWTAGISAPLPLRAPKVPPHDLMRREAWIDQRWSAQFWEAYDGERLRGQIARELELPVTVLNNPRSAAMAEAQLHPPGARFVYMMLGLGLGAAFVNGRVVNRDVWPHGGELGHIVLDGQPLTSVLSASSVRLALGLDQPHGEFEALVEVALAEEAPQLARWLDSASRLLSFIVNFLENALWPDGIVIGGFLPPALLEALVASALPLNPSVVPDEQDRDRIMPRLSVARHPAERIPFGSAATMLSPHANDGFADLLGHYRQSVRRS